MGVKSIAQKPHPALRDLAARLRRPAVVFELRGFPPSQDLKASWFGRVNLGSPGETWPLSAGKPMVALAQINLTELPFRPPGLEDLEFITVFIDAEELPNDSANGEGWCLRAYRRSDDLRPLAPVAARSRLKPFALRSIVVEQDFPCWDDVSTEIPAELANEYGDHFVNVSGFKLGGWPSLIQSEIFWAPWNKHPIAPRYVFQIDSTEKGHWAWGDGGVGYFGRGTVAGRRDDWALAWQCY